MLQQRLQQKLLQKLSPQQIQLMKLLQIPTVALEQRIKQEIEENPALEENAEIEDNESEDKIDNDTDSDDLSKEEQNEIEQNKDDEFDFSDYIDDDEPYYKYNVNNRSKDDEDRSVPIASGATFYDLLNQQLGMRLLSENQKIIAENIIGNLDDSGYLLRDINAMVDDFLFNHNFNTTPDEILEVLYIIQDFDPAGVGARNLKECLQIQLKRKNQDDENVKLAQLILERFFNEFTKKHYDKIIKRSNITEEELKDAINEILKLNPKPGNSLSESTKINQYILPDFIITNEDGMLDLKLNSRNAPELHVNKAYIEMLKSYSGKKLKNGSQQKDAVMFVKQKIDSAKWFIDAIKQRKNTLYLTMKTIMEYQIDYFTDGDETRLKPMILKDIAEIVNLDISTISRVANSKYVQTPFGTFLLKSFFSESLSTDSGEEVSTREVKKILQECVESEDKNKPFTDEHLAKILQGKGYNIARRTIAKYREQLKIPVARLRREL